MSACAMLTYNNMSDEAWNCIVAAVAPYGITPTSDTGTASSNGFEVWWNYDRANRVLLLQCLDSPFWLSCSLINGHINEVIENCFNQHGITIAPMTPI